MYVDNDWFKCVFINLWKMEVIDYSWRKTDSECLWTSNMKHGSILMDTGLKFRCCCRWLCFDTKHCRKWKLPSIGAKQKDACQFGVRYLVRGHGMWYLRFRMQVVIGFLSPKARSIQNIFRNISKGDPWTLCGFCIEEERHTNNCIQVIMN